eukprot:2215716-Prymnesium_polylepis.1
MEAARQLCDVSEREVTDGTTEAVRVRVEMEQRAAFRQRRRDAARQAVVCDVQVHERIRRRGQRTREVVAVDVEQAKRCQQAKLCRQRAADPIAAQGEERKLRQFAQLGRQRAAQQVAVHVEVLQLLQEAELRRQDATHAVRSQPDRRRVATIADAARVHLQPVVAAGDARRLIGHPP